MDRTHGMNRSRVDAPTVVLSTLECNPRALAPPALATRRSRRRALIAFSACSPRPSTTFHPRAVSSGLAEIDRRARDAWTDAARADACSERPTVDDARVSRSLLQQAIEGEDQALEHVIARLTPVVARRVIRALVRAGRTDTARNSEWVRDLTQDVFVDLFARDARVLRAWDPARGASLENYVGLVAERRTARRLERRRYEQSPTADPEDLAARVSSEASPEQAAMARSVWHELLERLEASLSPLGWQVFVLLFVEQKTVVEVGRETGLGRDAIYAWRSRLRKLARSLDPESTVSPAARRARPRPAAPTETSTPTDRRLIEIGGRR